MLKQYVVRISGEERKHIHNIASHSPKDAIINVIMKINKTYSKSDLTKLIKNIQYKDIENAYYEGYVIAEVTDKYTNKSNWYTYAVKVDNL